MKKSSYTIGNRTRVLPACSAVPQPTAPPRGSRIVGIPAKFRKKAHTEQKHRARYTPHIAPSAHFILSSIILSRYQKFEQSVLYEQCHILIEQEGRTMSSVNVSNASDLFPRGPVGHCSYILVYKF